MSGGSVFALMLLALFVDGAKVGADGLRHRVAFVFGLSAIKAGWDGSNIDRWTVGQMSGAIDAIARTGNPTLHLEYAPDVIGYLIGMVMLYAIGVMMPVRWARIPLIGGMAKLAFGTTKGRLNWRLWACAVTLGLMSDLTGGIVGGLVNSIITDILVPFCGHLPDKLFGHGGLIGRIA